MGRFYPLYFRRSDGKREVISHSKREINEPTPAQLDRKPNANGIVSYYRHVPLDDPKSLDWRRKIGGMIARELGINDPTKSYILAEFPENYRLYEHIKKAENEKPGLLSTQERMDAYMYGHPQGRKKRFRSPADFYHHVLWLATDQVGSARNCTCKLCSPLDIDDKTLATTVSAKSSAPVSPATTTPVTSATVTSTAAPKHDVPPAQEPKRHPQPVVVIPRMKKDPASIPTPKSAAEPKPIPTNLSTPEFLPAAAKSFEQALQPLDADQEIDVASQGTLFRQGELVWFNRNPNWGLGIILQRRKNPNRESSKQFTYLVQPLSHPYSHPPNTSLSDDHLIRPFLAWSIPAFSCVKLNHTATMFETADWQGMFEHKYDDGNGNFEMDGSILAAKSIDRSYSAFSPRDHNKWGGVFIGAEKIWLGDVVRLASVGGLAQIMVVRDIVEQGKELSLVGDVYSPRQIEWSDASNPFPNHLDNVSRLLPARLVADLTERNRLTIPKGAATTLFPVAESRACRVGDVCGRWYETMLLLPVMRGSVVDAQREIQAGKSDVSHILNKRFDVAKTPGSAALGAVHEVRTVDRRATLGAAVPADARIVDSVSTAADATIVIDP